MRLLYGYSEGLRKRLWLILTALSLSRYRGLICELIGEVEEVKSPCGCRGFDEYAPHINPSGRSSAEDMSRSLYIPGWE